LDGLADPESATFGQFLAGDHADEGRLTRAVRADHPDDPSRRQAKIEPLDQQPVAEPFDDPLRSDHEITEPWSRRQHDLRRFRRLLPALGDERLVGGKSRLALRLARPRTLPHPFELAFEGSPTGRLLPAL